MEDEKRTASPGQVDSGRDFGLEKGDYLGIFLKSLFTSLSLSWVFYNSILGMVVLPLVIVFMIKTSKEDKFSRELSQFDVEFKELLVAISDGLSSGYSVENAFKDAEESLKIMFGNKGMILEDLQKLNAKIAMRIPAEQAFLEFSENYPSEEARSFAGVFSFAKRLGGDYVKNLRRTVEKMEEKLELKQDIRALIAQKKMEFKVMCFMPAGILAYVKITSGDFLNSLYGNLMGVVAMTACILVYFGAIILGRKIVDIRV